MEDKNDILFLVALNHFPPFGQKSLKKLKSFFGTWENAFKASLKDLVKSGIRESVASEFTSARIKIDYIKLSECLEKENIGLVELNDGNYSRLLAEIFDPPALLFYKGNSSLLNTTSLGVVGTRKNTAYGEKVCTNICRDLIKNGFTVTSGLALGIDSIAHNTTLEHGGQTIAVLGSGINRASIYPSNNRYLADKIISDNGLIVSEFSIGTQALPFNFPMRNRIISGLSLGVIVIEAAIRSGALITARCALEQNREVFAVPGNIFSEVSAGPNALIKQGAIPCSSIEEIIETLDLKQLSSYINNIKIVPESREEEKIIPHLSHEPIHVDDLIRLSGLRTAELSSTLTLMEMRGVVKNFGGMKYALI